MAQNAVCVGTSVPQTFAHGHQLGGDWRWRATSAVPVVTTILTAEAVLTATFTGLAVGTYQFTLERLGIDGTTSLGLVSSTPGIEITADVTISVPQSIQVSVVQA